MKITLLFIGKTDTSYIKSGIDEYFNRVKHYVPIEIIIIPDIKNSKKGLNEIQKKREGKLIIKKFKKNDFIILLDEKGKIFTSFEFAQFIEKKMVAGVKNLVFVIGGPYGFSEEVYKKANHIISFSKMTFSHQLFRMIFVEQLYRAFTIMKGEPYHHD